MTNYCFFLFFDKYAECIAEKSFATEEEASNYADIIGADYFCSDEE